MRLADHPKTRQHRVSILTSWLFYRRGGVGKGAPRNRGNAWQRAGQATLGDYHGRKRRVVSVYFLDSSALVKRYVEERGSAWIQESTDPIANHKLVIARITWVEILSAFARRQR